ncbi:protein Atg16l2 [Ascaphus truei]|uniref:protein Atg16l2 n=1 Tax=Ascaphus truei TaxID=8439 RepID=UPI003F5A07E2
MLSEWVANLDGERYDLEGRVMVQRCANSVLKQEYDTLLGVRQESEEQLQKEVENQREMIEDLLKKKVLDAENQNQLNDRRKQDKLAREIKKALRKTLSIDVGFAPASCAASQEPSNVDISGTQECERPVTRASRSQSMMSLGSSKIVGAIKDIFDFRKPRTFSSSNDDHYPPVPVCVRCCLPKIALCNKEAHGSEVNAVKFSPNSRTVATGGADRVVKIWDIVGGMLQVSQTLEGSSSGITSIEFDPSGFHILAASYDGAVHLWKLDGKSNDSLTGHSAKVTAAKFKMALYRAVSGSLDRTVKEWDLQKAACIRSIPAFSYCSDVVCSDFFMISSHYDKKIRFWDSRSTGCIRELTLEEKITSLDMNQDQTQLLSCSRDDALNLIDLRTSHIRQVFRAEGFKCGCDWSKAIFSPDGSYTVAGSADGTIFIWNANTGALERSLNGQHNAPVNAVTWSASGDYLVSVDRGKKAVLWSEY